MLGLFTSALAVTNEFEFGDQVNEQRYLSYIAKIRCLVCQNESLGSSRSDLAIDLRQQIYEMMADGKSNQQISQFLVARYGDFILYQPPVKKTTLLLWLGPFIVLLTLLLVLVTRIKRMNNAGHELTDEQQQRARSLLSSSSENNQ